MEMTEESPRRVLREAAAIVAVFAAHFGWIRASNFGGWDEWAVIDVTSRGIVGLPFQNRPFCLVFNLVGSLLSPQGLWGFLLIHAAYLAGAGVLTFLVARRAFPHRGPLPWLAGVFCTVWAPLDDLRLDSVLVSSYSGAAFATALAVFLLLESFERRSVLLLVTGALVGAGVIRVVEATAALVGLAPLLLLTRSRDLRRLGPWCATWFLLTGGALALAAWPVLHPPPGGSYQAQALGFDPHPGRIALRMVHLVSLHVLPLFSFSWAELATWPAALSALVAFAAWWAVSRPPGPSGGRGDRRRAVLAAGIGLVAAALGMAVFALSPAIKSAARTQILSAPGVGLLLSGCVVFVAGLLGGRGRVVAGVLTALIAGGGTARVTALQREWGERSYWPPQRASLASLVREAPDLSPGTFVILLGGKEVWPATFTFHHALSYLYERRATGMAWDSEPMLYPASLGPQGLVVAPFESIRVPWGEPVRLYPYDHLVVARATPPSTLRILDTWPAEELGPLPADARYAPRDRISAGPGLPRARILDLR
jgi:hypothetical protein